MANSLLDALTARPQLMTPALGRTCKRLQMAWRVNCRWRTLEAALAGVAPWHYTTWDVSGDTSVRYTHSLRNYPEFEPIYRLVLKGSARHTNHGDYKTYIEYTKHDPFNGISLTLYAETRGDLQSSRELENAVRQACASPSTIPLVTLLRARVVVYSVVARVHGQPFTRDTASDDTPYLARNMTEAAAYVFGDSLNVLDYLPEGLCPLDTPN